MFPDAARLSRLRDYLSIRSLANIVALEEIQIIDPATGDGLTQESLNKLNHIRKAVYSSNNYHQIGLFEFHAGLLFLEQGWFSEAAESFRKAGQLWSFLPERPNICLANFAQGVAHHRDRRFELAETSYADVKEQIERIREEVNVPTSIPQIKKYQDFVKDLTAQLEEAQKTVTRDIFHDLSPRIHPSLQAETTEQSSQHQLQVDLQILQTNIQRNFSLRELQTLCFGMKIDFHGLDGNRLADKARELIAYCIRNRRVSGLLRELSNRKPSISWKDNIIQPPPEEELGEVVLDATEQEEVVDAQFEDVDLMEKEMEFSRSDEGEVRFQGEEEGRRPSDSPMVIVNIELSGDFNNFSLEEQVDFVNFISSITHVDPNQITILEAQGGSIKVTVEIPERSARLLTAMLLEKNPILRNFRIRKVELGDSVGPPTNTGSAINIPSNLLQKVTPQKLRQFLFLYFNDSELRDLYFDLDVDYDSLPGQGKRDKARELVAYCNRHSQSVQLVKKCHERRPKAFKNVFLDS